MNDLIKLLDKNLEYIHHNIEKDTIYINVKSIKKEMRCAYCNNYSTKVHSKYKKSFQDLPIQGMKVIIIIDNRKMFCKNDDCNHITFSEKFKFIHDKAKKTKRLEEKIIRLSLNMSSISASNYLKKNLVDIGKSTICTLLKKRNNNNQ
ncbi:MAG: transposase family protein [Sarcina sp.]